jgi:hypothetical protein
VTTPAAPTSVVILGAGLTGLATAFHLRRHGYRVTLLDHPKWQDGFGCNPSDAAPVLFGRHQETWGLLRSFNHPSSDTDTGLSLEFRLPDARMVAYRGTHLPGPLQWMMSLFNFHGLPWQDRWKLFSHLEQIWEQAQSLPADLEGRIADEWLSSIGQSETARRNIWHPLARWLTGNHLTRLSAASFVQVLSTLFLGQAMDARLTHVQGSVEDRLIAPLRLALTSPDATILRVTELPSVRFESQGVSGVHMADGTVLHARWYVSALSHHHLLSLLQERLLTRYAYFAQLGDLDTLGDITVQLTCRSAAHNARMLLLPEQPFQCLTVAPLGSETWLSMSLSNAPAQASDGEMISLAETTLRTVQPAIQVDRVLSTDVHRGKHAALALTPGANLLRPIAQSPVSNFLVSGPWTDTGWPANLESALVSARRCTEAMRKTDA